MNIFKILQSNKLKRYLSVDKAGNLQAKKGSALVAVLIILSIALLVITATMQNVLVDNSMSFNLKKSDEAYNNAVSAIEETTLRLIRDPSTSSITLNMNDGNVIIEITGDNPKTITVTSRVNSNQYICKIQATATYNVSGILTVNNIQELY